MNITKQKANNPVQEWAKGVNREFKERETQITYKHMKNTQLHSKLKKCKLKPLDMIFNL